MAINLSEIPTAVKTYLNTSVQIKVVAIAPANGTSISPNESFTIQLTVTNANSASGGIALNNLKLRMSVAIAGIATLLVPVNDGTSVSDDGTPLFAGQEVAQLNFIPLDRTLPVGGVRTFFIKGKAGGPGFGAPAAQSTSFRVRAFADVDLDQLFPKSEDTNEAVKVIHVAAS